MVQNGIDVAAWYILFAFKESFKNFRYMCRPPRFQTPLYK